MTGPIYPEIDATDGHILTPSTNALYQRAATALKTTGAQTVAGVLTFTDPPVVPTATTSGQAINKGQAETAIADALDSSDTLKVHTATTGSGASEAYASAPTTGQVVLWARPDLRPTNIKAGDIAFTFSGIELDT